MNLFAHEEWGGGARAMEGARRGVGLTEDTFALKQNHFTQTY